MSVLLSWVLFILAFFGWWALIIVGYISPGRLLPSMIGLVLVGVTVGMLFFPVAFGSGRDCGSLIAPRFDYSAGASHASLRRQCLSSEDAWGSIWFVTLVSAIGYIITGIYRSIGARRTVTLLIGVGVMISSAILIPERGIGVALKAGAVLTACAVVAGALTRKLGTGRRGVAVAVWTVSLGLGVYLIVQDLGWRGVVIMLAPLGVLALAAAGLVAED